LTGNGNLHFNGHVSWAQKDIIIIVAKPGFLLRVSIEYNAGLMFSCLSTEIKQEFWKNFLFSLNSRVLSELPVRIHQLSLSEEEISQKAWLVWGW
jgi:hypothetical protein